MKKAFFVLMALLLVFSWGGVAYADETGPGQSGTTLTTDISLDTTHTITWDWSIHKTGVLDKTEYYMHEDPVATYVVTLTKSGPTVVKTFSGVVTVTNGGDRDTRDLAISIGLYAREGSQWVLKRTVSVSTAGKPVLYPGETWHYAYSFGYDGADAGMLFKADSHITITNHSGHIDEPFGPSPDATATFPAAIVTNASVHVTDTWAGSLGEFSASGNVQYYRHFGPNVAGTFPNTATIDETGQSSSASVTIVRINNGMTKTIGYWKNHAGFGPQRDVLSPLLPVWLGTPGGASSKLVSSADEAVSFLNMSGGASNGIVKLYAQLLAAKLNIKNNVNGSAVSAVIANADAFLATHNQDNWKTLSKAQQNMVLVWMTALDNFNNGN